MHLKFSVNIFVIFVSSNCILANDMYKLEQNVERTLNISGDLCPELVPPLDHLTQEELIEKITDRCRYDRLIKPETTTPLFVELQIDVIHVEYENHLRFKSHILVQVHYWDHRLDFHELSPKRGSIMGEKPLRNRIWVPHIAVTNERSSFLMGLDSKDVFVKIGPHGNVAYSYRMTTNFYCWMNLRKFPFDHQTCDITWASWMYNTSSLDLNWARVTPYKISKNLHLTEFTLTDYMVRKTVESFFDHDEAYLSGEYSALVFEFKLHREVGYYILVYFLPSILLVVMSWVTFYIQANVAPARVALGTATMLSLITLNGNVTNSLPKVSYVKASEIWFFGCATFIFCSLAEFAFVNVIWRRQKDVKLLKQSTARILKAGVSPRLVRKELKKSESLSNLEKSKKQGGSSSSLHVPTVGTQKEETKSISMDSEPPTPTSRPAWTSMTPHEIAIWIDKRSRIVFPLAFIAFNLFYWVFIYAL